MTVKYGKFELPTNIKIEEATKTETYSRFIAEAFERGFGHTIGNALRRIMLNSLEAPALISVKIEGVPHEYIAIEGIIEDMTHIILNFKGTLLRKLPLEENRDTRGPKMISKTLEVTQDMLDAGGGQYAAAFKDVMGESDFEMVNPDHHLFTVTTPMRKRVDLKIAIGRGYVPSERHDIQDKVIDEIVIDSAFSPVRLVNYFVENTRVGQDTDYDRLILEVTTDGRVTPQEALIFSTQIGVLHLGVFDTLKFQDLSFDHEEMESDSDRDELLSKLTLRINEIELSVRSTNCLAQANIDTIAELVIMPEPEMLKFRNFGKKSLSEIKAKLEDMSLHLGMNLSRYGITRDNVRQTIDEYLEEKSGQETP
ncbi:MAG: DNA-directed RNA polymerase subunit alpha [Candidatus Neptunochlamydia sp.]|nr:DNA-directed RNA polymerase subunit alpha [Candidatus Neptunochlamydia sp.]